VKRFRQVAAFLLAGGASSRMGQDKGLLEFDGVPLIVRTSRLLEPLVAGVTLVGSARSYAGLDLSTIPDQAAGEKRVAEKAPGKLSGGPLNGIAAALAATRSPWNLIVACDLPYLTAAWLEWLLARAVHSRAQAVIPRTERGLEPLAALYRRECGPPIAGALARGVRKVTDAIGELNLDVVHQREWRRLDPGGMILMNMNTPADYEEALRWANGERVGEGKHVRKPLRSGKRKRRSALRPSK
jgi:molybdopterin-guanine dinucleotide biosynthesis protein A